MATPGGARAILRQFGIRPSKRWGQHFLVSPHVLDRTVAAGRLLDAINPGHTAFALPDALLGGPAWAGLLPPRRGWAVLGELPVRELAAAVARGNADFRFGALGRDRAGLDALAEEIWSRELRDGLRWRCAHAAAAVGFLGADPERSEESARVAAHGRWLRLDAPFGTVVERATDSG